MNLCVRPCPLPAAPRREAADGAYSAASFVLTYTTLEVPCEILSALVFTAFAQAIAGAAGAEVRLASD